MLIHVLGIVFPIFAVVVTGYAYARWRDPDMTVANALNMDVFIPALLFVAVADPAFKPASFGTLAVAGLAVVLGSGLLAWPVAYGFKWRRLTFVPPMMFNNCGNVGLPLSLLAFGEDAFAGAIVLFLVSNTTHFSFGNWLLSHKARWGVLARNPILITTVLALALNLGNVQVPGVLWDSIDMLGQICIPLMLFSLGVRMKDVDFSDWTMGAIGAIVCPLSGLLVALPVAWVLGLDGVNWAQLMVFSVLPPAVLNFMFAEKHAQEPRKVASIVLVGNMVSVLTIPAVLYWVL